MSEPGFVGLSDYREKTRAEVRMVDADISSVSAATDKILVVQESPPWMLHLELQSGYEADMIERFHGYCVLERRRHRLPVRLYVILLRPEADGADVTGLLEFLWSDGDWYERFRYFVIRAWEKPVEEILQGGLATLPLAPVSDVRSEALPGVIRRMEERISAEAPKGVAEDLWTATYLLMGLRYSPEIAGRLLQGVRNMKESSTYQAILQEGEAIGEARGETRGITIGETRGATREARKAIVLFGRKRFGEPPPQVQTSLDAITEVEALDRLIERIQDVETWEDLLKGA